MAHLHRIKIFNVSMNVSLARMIDELTQQINKSQTHLFRLTPFGLNCFIGRRVYLLGTLQNGLKMSKWSCLSSILDFDEILFLKNFSLFPKKQLILKNKSKFGC